MIVVIIVIVVFILGAFVFKKDLEYHEKISKYSQLKKEHEDIRMEILMDALDFAKANGFASEKFEREKEIANQLKEMFSALTRENPIQK